jgi:hypothetical protein
MSDKPNIGTKGATEEEAKSVKAKVELVMGMSGRDHGMKLTVLSYALIFTAAEAQVTFASLIKNLAEMYDVQCEEGDENEQDKN